MKISRITVGITLVLLALFLFFGAAGTFASMHANHAANFETAPAVMPCPLNGNATMCPLAPFEHLKHFKSLIASLVPVSVLALLVGLFALAAVDFLKKDFFNALALALTKVTGPQRAYAYEFVRPPQLRFFTKANQRLYE